MALKEKYLNYVKIAFAIIIVGSFSFKEVFHLVGNLHHEVSDCETSQHHFHNGDDTGEDCLLCTLKSSNTISLVPETWEPHYSFEIRFTSNPLNLQFTKRPETRYLRGPPLG